MNFVEILMEKLERKIKRSVCISKRGFMLKYYPLCSILNSAYYANNYASIFDAGLTSIKESGLCDYNRMNVEK